MSLALSCENLYFPPEPRDNIITLQWNNNDTPLEPNTSVIYKVKCTAPQLFHVVPRYGAILLADATGASVQYSHKASEITFGLREHHAGAEEEAGAAGGGNGAAAAPSALNRNSTARTSRAASAAPGGGPAYQERFAVEYVMIKSEPLAFQQIFNSLADHAKLTEVVKNMWSLVASGAIPRAHLGVQASLNMKVFMENVVLSGADGGAAGQIPVPPEARLVVPSSHDRQSHTSNRNQSSATSRRPSEAASATNSTPASSRRKPVDEMRALKEEINIMRRDSAATPRSNPSPHNVTSPNAAAAGATPPAASRRLADALSPPQSNSPAGGGVVPPLAAGEGSDVIMKFDAPGESAGEPGKKKKGLKVYLVLVIMFVLYIFLLIMRRGAKHSVETISAGADDADATAGGLTVQVSSRELEKTNM